MNRKIILYLLSISIFLIPSIITGRINIMGLNNDFLSVFAAIDYFCRTICYIVGIILLFYTNLNYTKNNF